MCLPGIVALYEANLGVCRLLEQQTTLTNVRRDNTV